jgi:hypothetical protein
MYSSQSGASGIEENYAMSDRTMIAVGRNSVSVPKIAKRTLEVLIAAALTSLVALAIVVTNSVLMGRGGFQQGLDLWYAFIRRSDIMGTMLVTAIVTVAYIRWQRERDRK